VESRNVNLPPGTPGGLSHRPPFRSANFLVRAERHASRAGCADCQGTRIHRHPPDVTSAEAGILVSGLCLDSCLRRNDGRVGVACL
jgi:hypothetical protein